MVGLSRTTIWRREREGDFPQRIHLGGRRVGWHADEVIAWLEARPKGLIGQSCKTHHG
ncbi:AlpA family phage regulatory protein [Parasedimentitalea psychrophila]|uniref:AlpA family phage regulatory protein n=2 Tax=Parasedimentitalea psychrophila TaxID=2997337 RepID=A0A9Y2L591_9RHOB|nr:AlpA family phage regulatory protein [Parasedimentitalea psychrophila]